MQEYCNSVCGGNIVICVYLHVQLSTSPYCVSTLTSSLKQCL